MGKKHKKVCTTLNYIEHFLILASTITEFQFQFQFLRLFLCLVLLYELRVMR